MTTVNPIIIGLAIGLTLGLVIYISEFIKRNKLKKEIKSLKLHLYQKMDIDSEANEMKKDQIETLKKENENLRISVESLSQKPGRREIINYHIYQKAVDKVLETAPGFSPLWQKALKEATKEIEEFEVGKLPFIKKLLPKRYFDGEE